VGNVGCLIQAVILTYFVKYDNKIIESFGDCYLIINGKIKDFMITSDEGKL
jgi:hypothetical protein